MPHCSPTWAPIRIKKNLVDQRDRQRSAKSFGIRHCPKSFNAFRNLECLNDLHSVDDPLIDEIFLILIGHKWAALGHFERSVAKKCPTGLKSRNARRGMQLRLEKYPQS